MLHYIAYVSEYQMTYLVILFLPFPFIFLVIRASSHIHTIILFTRNTIIMSKTRTKPEFSQLSFTEQMNHINNYLFNGNYPLPAMSEKQKCSFRCTALTYRYDHKKQCLLHKVVTKQNEIGNDEGLCNFQCIFNHALFATIINFVFI